MVLPAVWARYSALGFLVTGLVSAIAAADAHYRTAALVSAAIALLAGAALVMLPWFLRNANAERRAVTALQSGLAQTAAILLVITLAAALYVVDASADMILRLSPLLAWFWIVGCGFVIAFPRASGMQEQSSAPASTSRPSPAAWLGLLLCICILLLPARLPTVLDGLPWNTPAEFLFVAFLLPLAFILARREFGRRPVLASLFILMVIRAAAAFLLPQAGLSIRAFRSPQDLASGTWARTYASILAPSSTQIITAPYLSYREFPIEWINSAGFVSAGFQQDLQLVGFARLRPGERLVFLVQGAKTAEINLVDSSTGRGTPAVLISDLDQLDLIEAGSLPEFEEFKIEGHLTYRKLGQARLEPLLLSAAGEVESALAASRIWVDDAPRANTPDRFVVAGILLDGTGVALIGIVAGVLLMGLLERFQTGRLSWLDLYLAGSGLLVLGVGDLVPKPQFNLLATCALILLGSAKVCDAMVYPRRQSMAGYFLSIGIAFLLIFALLDLGSLRSVTILPQGQDGLEYQIFARSIYVGGDPLLLQTPPRAYKVLFPYLVGLLHVLFGQSSSAQLFLNAWAALLSSILLVRFSRIAASSAIAFAAGLLLLITLCATSAYAYYFRFGLIEPVAVLLLLVTCCFAARGHRLGMFIAGILTTLLRLDYIGVVIAAVILTAAPILGTTAAAWRLLAGWVGSHLKSILAYAAAVALPPLLIILGYSTLTTGYVLNATDTLQTSAASIADGLLRVIAGGNVPQIQGMLTEEPVYVLLVVLPLVAGFLVALASLLYRRGALQAVDLRWGLLVLSLLPVYVIVRPTGYAPRFSLPLLPFDLVLLGLLLNQLLPAQHPDRHDAHQISQ